MGLKHFGEMGRFSIAPDFDAACHVSNDSIAGEVYHVVRNEAGGGTYTPVARFFAWRPPYSEGFHAHWRVDCFVSLKQKSPRPKVLGLALAKGLLRESLCAEPLWVSWHQSKELNGKAFGEVFDLDD